MFEHVAAQRIVRVYEGPGRSSNAGNCEAAAHWGRLFFGYFLLAKQKKVTGCRATPDGFDFGFEFENSGLRPSFDTAAPTQDERSPVFTPPAS
jgi:hypothetical protein